MSQGRWIGLAGIAVALMAGCHQPYFMTEIDYAHYNKVSADVPPARYQDESMAPTSVPRSVRNPSGHEQWDLTLAEAKRVALENNKQIALLQYQPGEAGADIDFRLASFDTQFEAGAGWKRVDRQSRTLITTTGAAFTEDRFGGGDPGFGFSTTSGGPASDPLAGVPNVGPSGGADMFVLAKRNAAGGLTRISYSLEYNKTEPPSAFIALNPAWTSEVELRIEQPLLQGAGVEFNRAPLLVARATHQQAIKDFQTSIHTLLRDIEVAYWELYFTYQNLYSRETGMQQALATWQKEKNKEYVGVGSRPDVAQAREQFEFFRASRLEALAGVIEQERLLRELMGLPPDDGKQIVPADAPSIAEFEPAWVLAVLESMDLRPELAGQRFAIRAAELNYFQQKNGLKPDLTVGGVWEISGLDNQFDQSIGRLNDNRFADWTLGLRIRQPIGERAAHASVREAHLVLSRQRATLRNLEHTVLHELYTSYQEIVTAFELIGAQKDRREAAAVQLEAREQFYRQGKTTIDVLLQAQTTFADALRDESEAITRYNQALVRWEFAKGTILEHDNVALAEERLELCGELSGKWHWSEKHWLNLRPGDVVKGELAPVDDSGPLYPTELYDTAAPAAPATPGVEAMPQAPTAPQSAPAPQRAPAPAPQLQPAPKAAGQAPDAKAAGQAPDAKAAGQADLLPLPVLTPIRLSPIPATAPPAPPRPW